MKGQRKTAFGFLSLGVLTLGLSICIAFPAGAALFPTYAAAVTGIAGLVIAGNVGAKFAGKGENA